MFFIDPHPDEVVFISQQMDAVTRSCTVTATTNAHIVILQVNFPPSYPYNAAPTFQFAQGTSIDNNKMAKLLKVIFFYLNILLFLEYCKV
jgi:hypothetical protein